MSFQKLNTVCLDASILPLTVFCSSVALNYQSWDQKMFLNEAKFSLNGHCGYVLMPEFLRKGNFRMDSPDPSLKKTLVLRVRKRKAYEQSLFKKNFKACTSKTEVAFCLFGLSFFDHYILDHNKKTQLHFLQCTCMQSLIMNHKAESTNAKDVHNCKHCEQACTRCWDICNTTNLIS